MTDGSDSGTILNVHGTYSAQNGILDLDTRFDGSSPGHSDRLHILGDSQGSTILTLHNTTGSGALTPQGDNEGILLIEVDGDSSGTFRLDHSPYDVGNYLY